MDLRRTQPTVIATAGALSLFLVSCVPWQWDYLIEAAGRATQDDVQKRFGAPLLTKSLGESGSSWTYRYEVKSSFVGRRGDMLGGAACIEYLLTFDTQEILTYWVRQPC
ncbi:MAG TPA: hypothetical protein VJM82_00865 [Nitrospiraceae bacterium]|nr:hypothetical protein [Nitrospiraceae bacterium]